MKIKSAPFIILSSVFWKWMHAQFVDNVPPGTVAYDVSFYLLQCSPKINVVKLPIPPHNRASYLMTGLSPKERAPGVSG